jgi:kumamolisin
MPIDAEPRGPVPGADRTGPLAETERVEFTVVLRRRTPPGQFPDVLRLGDLGSPRRGRLSREEFAARHGAHPDDLAAVERFAREHRLAVGQVSVGGRTVRLAGSAGTVGHALGVEFERWRSPTGTYRTWKGRLVLPPSLESVVVALLGLDDRPLAKPHFRRRATPAPSDTSYAPPTVAAAYDFPPGTTGTGQTLAILELGGGFSPGDLTKYFAQLGVPAPTVTVVSVDGASNAPTGNPDGSDAEVELDLEVAGSVAPEAVLVVYFAPNTDSGFTDGVTQALHDTTHRPSILSISWGGPESSWPASARAALNTACEDGAAMGVTVLVAAGDDGATDGTATGALTVDFPASSPYVTACGGTRLVLRGTTIANETVWNDLAEGEGATGGGVSEAFPLPSYQSGIGVPTAPNGFVGRGVPDVAGDADPTTGYSVLLDGSETVIGGTSAVAPLWAALVARLNQALGAPVGFLNPQLYSAATRATFHDITSGNNDGYSAGPGWSPCTGWGSPDGNRLLQSLRSPPASD